MLLLMMHRAGLSRLFQWACSIEDSVKYSIEVKGPKDQIEKSFASTI